MISNKKTLGWGLIGASNIAKQYMIPAINEQPDSQVVAVMSSSEARGKEFAEKNAVPHTHHSLEGLLNDPAVDVVYISTTNELHKPQTVASAKAGKHVLCEKPLALTLADAREMVNACRAAGVVMGTNHHLRNAVTHGALRKMISNGEIGKPLSVRLAHAVHLPGFLQGWRINSAAAGGGVILDITVHDTDTLRFVLNDEVDEVMAIAVNQGMAAGGLDDAVMGVMHFKQGTIAQFHDAFTVAHSRTALEIQGTDASLIAENVMTQEPVGTIKIQRGSIIENVPLDRPEDLYIRAVRRFNQAVRGNGEPSATAGDGLRSLAVALAVRESAKTGRRVKVRYV